MGRQELIAALEEEAELSIAQLRAESERRQEVLRTECAQRHERCLAATVTEWQQTENELRRQKGTVARQIARGLLLDAEARLAARLRHLAHEQLPALALTEGCRERLFAELPSVDWDEVRVAEGDLAAARQAFPHSRATAVPEIYGGIAACGDGITVDNTLEKRLERGWDDLLPDIMAEIRKELSNACAAAPA